MTTERQLFEDATYNEDRMTAWEVWQAARALPTADAEELQFLRGDLLYWVDRAVGKGNANSDIEGAYERYEAWLAQRFEATTAPATGAEQTHPQDQGATS